MPDTETRIGLYVDVREPPTTVMHATTETLGGLEDATLIQVWLELPIVSDLGQLGYTIQVSDSHRVTVVFDS